MKERQELFNKVFDEFKKIIDEGKLTDELKEDYNNKLMKIALNSSIDENYDLTQTAECSHSSRDRIVVS